LPAGERVRAEVRVEGRVQGVFFRSEAQQRARSRGVTGWIRNAPDGSVEGVFEGEREAVESLVRWCGEGPRGARVDDVRVRWADPRGEEGFRIR
jgi:acylphosphatase